MRTKKARRTNRRKTRRQSGGMKGVVRAVTSLAGRASSAIGQMARTSRAPFSAVLRPPLDTFVNQRPLPAIFESPVSFNMPQRGLVVNHGTPVRATYVPRTSLFTSITSVPNFMARGLPFYGVRSFSTFTQQGIEKDPFDKLLESNTVQDLRRMYDEFINDLDMLKEASIQDEVILTSLATLIPEVNKRIKNFPLRPITNTNTILSFFQRNANQKTIFTTYIERLKTRIELLEGSTDKTDTDLELIENMKRVLTDMTTLQKVYIILSKVLQSNNPEFILNYIKSQNVSEKLNKFHEKITETSTNLNQFIDKQETPFSYCPRKMTDEELTQFHTTLKDKMSEMRASFKSIPLDMFKTIAHQIIMSTLSECLRTHKRCTGTTSYTETVRLNSPEGKIFERIIGDGLGHLDLPVGEAGQKTGGDRYVQGYTAMNCKATTTTERKDGIITFHVKNSTYGKKKYPTIESVVSGVINRKNTTTHYAYCLIEKVQGTNCLELTILIIDSSKPMYTVNNIIQPDATTTGWIPNETKSTYTFRTSNLTTVINMEQRTEMHNFRFSEEELAKHTLLTYRICNNKELIQGEQALKFANRVVESMSDTIETFKLNL